ncbi:MAG: hypothetical protein ACOH2E_03780 [Candidatus Paracaedibacter sp.]
MHQTQKKLIALRASAIFISQLSNFLSFGNVGVILACLALLMPLCSLPPTRMGYYNQVESCLIAFWLISAGVGLWIYFLMKKCPRLVYHTSKLPIVWGPILLGMTTILVSPFHVLPLRDLIGSPHIAEGALTFIASGLLASNFSILTRIATYRKIIFTMAFLVGLTISTLTIVGSMESPFISWRYWQWAPYFFPDYLSFICISLAALYVYVRKDLKCTYLNDIIAFALFTLIAYYASNKSLGYGIILSLISIMGIWLFPAAWKRTLLHVTFFGLSFSLTLLIVFYDECSKALPEFLGHLSTITSRTWLSKVTFVDLTTTPLSWAWIQQLLIGKGWGTFNNISASNMFLIDQVSIFNGKDYNPSWELTHRDLLHTHNILTNYFHSIGLLGVSLYLYIQYKFIKSLSKNHFFAGIAFLISYQVQLLFWFQFIITVPFTILTLAVFFRRRTPVIWSFLLKPKFILGFAAFLLIFSSFQGIITWGHESDKDDKQPTKESIRKLTTASYIRLEAYFGAQRQVGLARIFATNLQDELKNNPAELVTHSLKLVNHLKCLPKGGNYLSNNLAINILSELASKQETLKLLNTHTLITWEQLAKDHIKIMPYRTDILLPFFNLYQTLGKEAIVLEFTKAIYEKNSHDSIALWFMGSSFLKNPAHFDTAMCILQKSIREGIERFMPVPPTLKTKIVLHAKTCPQDNLLFLF